MNNYMDLIYDVNYTYLQASIYGVDSHLFDGKILGSRSYGLKIKIQMQKNSCVISPLPISREGTIAFVCLSVCLSAFLPACLSVLNKWDD